MIKRHSKSSMMLLEIMINICFFAFLIAVCLSLLFKSLQISNKAKDLNHAVSILNSLAATCQELEGDTESIAKELKPTSNDTDSIIIYYDKDYQISDKSKARYEAKLVTDSPKTDDSSDIRCHLTFRRINQTNLIYEEKVIIHHNLSVDNPQKGR